MKATSHSGTRDIAMEQQDNPDDSSLGCLADLVMALFDQACAGCLLGWIGILLVLIRALAWLVATFRKRNSSS